MTTIFTQQELNQGSAHFLDDIWLFYIGFILLDKYLNGDFILEFLLIVSRHRKLKLTITEVIMKNIMTIVFAVFLMALNNFAADNAASKEADELTKNAEILNYYDANWCGLQNEWQFRKGAIVSKVYNTKDEAEDAYERFRDKLMWKGFEIKKKGEFISSSEGGERIRCPEFSPKDMRQFKRWHDLRKEKERIRTENTDLAAKLDYIEDILSELYIPRAGKRYPELIDTLMKDKQFGLKHINIGYSQIWPYPNHSKNGFVITAILPNPGLKKEDMTKMTLTPEKIDSIITFIETKEPQFAAEIKKQAVGKRRNI